MLVYKCLVTDWFNHSLDSYLYEVFLVLLSWTSINDLESASFVLNIPSKMKLWGTKFFFRKKVQFFLYLTICTLYADAMWLG